MMGVEWSEISCVAFLLTTRRFSSEDRSLNISYPKLNLKSDMVNLLLKWIVCSFNSIHDSEKSI